MLGSDVETISSVFSIIDPLDEDDKEEQGILKVVQRIVIRQYTLCILVTSRKEPKIEKMIEALVLSKISTSLEGIGVDSDIRSYIRFQRSTGHLSTMNRLLQANAKADARNGAPWSVLEMTSSHETKHSHRR